MICFFLRKCFVSYVFIIKDGSISELLIILHSPGLLVKPNKESVPGILITTCLKNLYVESSLVLVYICLNCFDSILVWLWDLFNRAASLHRRCDGYFFLSPTNAQLCIGTLFLNSRLSFSKKMT